LRRGFRPVRPVALFLLALASAGTARATQVQALALPELVRRSATIVHGTVQETHTAWEDGTARLYTYVTISPLELVKGTSPAGRAITFRQLGGRDGDRIVYVPGTPRFSPKQEVLLFLTGNDAGGYPQVMGIFQGAFRLASGPGGLRRVEAISPGAAGSILPGKAKGPGQPSPEPVPGGSFGDFMERIRALVKDQATGPAR
jgi:hypothetical protein